MVYEKLTTFEIPFSVRNDTGKYTIKLVNDLGTATASANVTVLGTQITYLFQSAIDLIV